METVTCTAPVNIAVIKYWGKRDEHLVLPINSSLSVTLHQDDMRSKTTIAASSRFAEDKMWLNGVEQSLSSPRFQNVLKEIRRRARKRRSSEGGSAEQMMFNWNVHICSENNFPTAAGLASSASGFACLVYTLAKLYRVDGEISDVARLGSGSACRSIYGGFVEWEMGQREDGTDSIAKQIAPEDHWLDLRVLILVVSDQTKHIGSSQAMQISVKTSDIIQHLASTIVPKQLIKIKDAIKNKDFTTFAEVTMKASNYLHAICLETSPSISYMTDTSRHIQSVVHHFNQIQGEVKLAYTFDAGPNACLYLLEDDVPKVISLIKHFYPPETNERTFIRGIDVPLPDVSADVEQMPLDIIPGGLKYVIHTTAGPGPRVMDNASLLNDDGLPLTLTT